VLIAIGNSGDSALAQEATRLLDDASPLVRGAAVWALSRLLSREELKKLWREDADTSVQEEWRATLS
jgi:epoxyqueuosine reductase